jgi:hypothetical protein
MAFIATFVVLRMIAAIHTPVRFSDTGTYFPLDFFGGQERLWTVPLIWKIFSTDWLREAAQLTLGITAWSALGINLSRAVENAWLRRGAFALALAVGLVPQVSGWDSTLLSESLATSFLVLLIALLLGLHERPTGRLIAGCVAVTAFWIFTRQLTVLIFLSMLPFVVVFTLRTRIAVIGRVWIVAALITLGVWGGFAVTRPASQEVVRWNALQILENRIAPDPAALQFFEAHGLPRSPTIRAEKGAFPGSTSPLFSDAAVMRWIDHHYKATYLAYLIRHWRSTLATALFQLPAAASSTVTVSGRPVLPWPVAEVLWGTQQGDVTFWVVVALALGAAAIVARRRIRCLPVAALLLLCGLVGAVVTWNLTGYGQGTELGRLFMPVAVVLRAGALILIFTSIDALVRRGSPATAPG